MKMDFYFLKPVLKRNLIFNFIKEGKILFFVWLFFSGQNVEEAFLETAKKIYQNILDGSLDLNAAETGVQPKQPLPKPVNASEQKPSDSQCSC